LLDKKGFSDGGWRRRWFRPQSRQPRRRSATGGAAIEAGWHFPGEDVLNPAWIARLQSSTKTANTSWRAKRLQTDFGALVDYLANLADLFPIVSIEDGMAEGGLEGWKLRRIVWARKSRSSRRCVRDHTRIFKVGIKQGIANSILIRSTRSAPCRRVFLPPLIPTTWPFHPVISASLGRRESQQTIAGHRRRHGTRYQIKTGSLSVRIDRQYNPVACASIRSTLAIRPVIRVGPEPLQPSVMSLGAGKSGVLGRENQTHLFATGLFTPDSSLNQLRWLFWSRWSP